MKQFNFSNIFSAAILAGLFISASASAQQKEYTDGVFMLNEGNFGKECATINFLDRNGNWENRLPITMNGEKIELGATGCYATICGENMYIVCKKKRTNDLQANDPTLVVCDAKTMEAKAVINSIKTNYGAAADGRAFLPVAELNKGYLSTTNGVYVISLESYEVVKLIEGTDGLTNNQTGNMIYHNGKVYAVDVKRGLLVIDTKDDKLVKTINNEGEKGTYCSIVQAKDGSIWLTAGVGANGKTADHLVKFDPETETTENISLPSDVKQPTNNWGAWNPDCFTASTTENVLFWNGATGPWTNGQHIYKFDIDSKQTVLLLDFTADADPKPYVYGAACRVNPDNGDLYLSVTKGSAWGDESELRVYNSTDATLKATYPMEKNYWFPEMPVFSLKSSATSISSISTNLHEVARYSIDGRRINQPQKGLNIVKFSDGSVKKVVVE